MLKTSSVPLNRAWFAGAMAVKANTGFVCAFGTASNECPG